jgi:hypothetical protein
MLRAGINYCSVSLTQQKQQTTQQRKTKMPAKKNIKVKDLKPVKDAKGGRKQNRNK